MINQNHQISEFIRFDHPLTKRIMGKRDKAGDLLAVGFGLVMFGILYAMGWI